jgi:periplasmic divalent cation tolerance protein
MTRASDPTGIVIVLTTLEAGTDASAVARALVKERLAACVGILPGLISVYRWQGDVEEAHEQQLIVKTSSSRLEALETRLHQLHTHDLPEFIVLGAEASIGYQAWVEASTVPVKSS